MNKQKKTKEPSKEVFEKYIKEYYTHKNVKKIKKDLEDQLISFRLLYIYIKDEILDQLKESKSDPIKYINENEHKIHLNNLVDLLGKQAIFTSDQASFIPYKDLLEIIYIIFDIAEDLFDKKNDQNLSIQGSINAIFELFAQILLVIEGNYLTDTFQFFLMKSKKFNYTVDHAKKEKIVNTLHKKLSKNFQFRKFIYSLNYHFILWNNKFVPDIADNFKILIGNLTESFKSELIMQTIEDISNIVKIFQNNIECIDEELKNAIIYIITNNTEVIKDSNVKLFKFIPFIFEGNNNIGIFNFLMRIYISELGKKSIVRKTIILSLKEYLIDFDNYSWVIKETNFKKDFIKNLLKENDENIIDIYFNILLKFCNEGDKNKNMIKYLPETEIVSILNSLKIFSQDKAIQKGGTAADINIEILKKILWYIKSLINNNIDIIRVIFNKSHYCDYYFEIMEIRKNDEKDEVKNIFVNFHSFLIKTNKGKYTCNFQGNLPSAANEAFTKTELMNLEYENDVVIINDKLEKFIAYIMTLMGKKTKFFDLIECIKTLFKNFYSKDFNILNNLTADHINSLYNIIEIFSGIVSNDNHEFILHDLLQLIYEIIINSNMTFINYKLNYSIPKNKKYFKTQNIILIDRIKLMLQSLLLYQHQNIKNKTFEYFNNNYLSCNSLFISYPFAFSLLFEIFTSNDYINYLNDIKAGLLIMKKYIEKNKINVKIFHYSNVEKYILNLIYQIYTTKNQNNLQISDEENDIVNLCLDIMVFLVNYTNKEELSLYLSKCFCLINHNINNEKIVLKLINCIKESLDNKNNIYEGNFITLCNDNNIQIPYLYNFLHIGPINNYNNKNKISFLYYLKIKSFENISTKFNLLNIKNDNLNFYISIDNSKSLIVSVLDKTIYTVKDIDKILQNDKYYEVIIDIDNEEHKMNMCFIDKEIEKKDNLINDLEIPLLQIENFEVDIGFTGNDLIEEKNLFHQMDTKTEENNTENNSKICLIDLSYILITNNSLLGEENSICQLLDDNKIYLSKGVKLFNYLDESEEGMESNIDNDVNLNNVNSCILAEFSFDDILLTYSNKIEKYENILINNFYVDKETTTSINENEVNNIKKMNIEETNENKNDNNKENNLENIIIEENTTKINEESNTIKSIENDSEIIPEKNKIRRYIPIIKFNAIHSVNMDEKINKCVNLYLISKEDNIKTFLSRNSIFQLEYLHKSQIQNQLFSKTTLDVIVKNSYFIDFLFMFMTECEITGNFLIELLKLILSIDSNQYFINAYFDIFKTLFNQKYLHFLEEGEGEFINKLLDINIKENKIIFIEKCFIYILLDEIIFKNTNIGTKNIIIKKFKQQVDILITNNCYTTLYKSIEKLFNIITYFEIEDEDLIVNIINLIVLIYEFVSKQFIRFSTNDALIKSMNKINDRIVFYGNLINNLEKFEEEHDIKNKIKLSENSEKDELKIINILGNKKIKKQFAQIKDILLAYLKDSNSSLYQLTENNEKYLSFKCIYCDYILKYFEIFIKYLHYELKLEKIQNKVLHDNYLLNNELQKIFDEKNYFCWYLSSKECLSRMRNKLVLKRKDKIKDKKKYKYRYNKEYFQKYYKYLNNIFIYDNILTNHHFVNNLTEDNIYQYSYNCLYIKQLNKTNSLFILTDKFLYIYTNIIIDKNGCLHTSKGNFSELFWAVKDYQEEWDNYCFNENYKVENKETGFGYKNYKFTVKKISYKNISEIYKRSHLHIENSIELFLKNGSSYFVAFNKDKRDEIFMKILTNIQLIYQGNEKKDIEGMEILQEESCKNQIFYMKYCPFIKEEESVLFKNNTKPKKFYSKRVIDINSILKSISSGWAKRFISNYDYISLLNILSGRSYNDLSQYIIFPWIIRDYFDDFNLLDKNLYRELKYPVFASTEQIREQLEVKYELKEIEPKYHSGTFYSTHAFVSYYLIRLNPFTNIALEIQNGQFDATDRIFHSINQISSMEEKSQELVPELFYLPESLVNINNFEFGKTQKKKVIDGVSLPIWCENDPRLFIIMHKVLLESKIVSEKLNLWIDMIFGFRQQGVDSKEILNTFRPACYYSHYKEIEGMNKTDLDNLLFEKNELGVNPNQLFNNPHEEKKNIPWFASTSAFFDNRFKLFNYEHKLEKVKVDIYSGKISEILFVNEKDMNNTYQGGLSSLNSIVNYCKSLFYRNNGIDKNIKINVLKYVIVSKGLSLLGKKNNKYVYFYDNTLRICSVKYNVIYQYNLYNENNKYSKISCITSNKKGNKLYIAFSNGNIIEFKIKNFKKDILTKNDDQGKIIKNVNEICREKSIKTVNSINNSKLQGLCINKLDNLNSINNTTKISTYYPRIFFANKANDYCQIILPSKKEKVVDSQSQIKHNTYKIYYLVKTENQIKISQNKISMMKLNEVYSLLIVADIHNIIYLYRLNSNLSLLNTVTYISDLNIPIKSIIPIEYSGEFLICTPYNVYLFSCNGVPLSELNLLEKEIIGIPPMTCYEIAYINDVVLFTGHTDGTINIWKVKTKEISSSENTGKFNEHNDNKFLNDYKYCYKRQQFEKKELKRKFEYVTTIQVKEINKGLIFLKLSCDYSKIYIFDEDSNIYSISSPNLDRSLTCSALDSERCECCKRFIEGLPRGSMYTDVEQPEIIKKRLSKKNINYFKLPLCGECNYLLNDINNLIYGC